LAKLRATIRSAVPPETTETISYRIPTFQYKGGLVAFAAFTNHCSFFPMSSSLLSKFKEDLKGFPTAKGTIRFPLDRPLPASLVRKLVKARIEQNEQKEELRTAAASAKRRKSPARTGARRQSPKK
jgi:uncharacterized protein YdhG (YjbR/CyaY superfamily)